METPTEPYCNLIYQYGQQRLLYLSRKEFLKFKPSIGHVRDSRCFPEEQRITFTRFQNSAYVENPRDEGRYSFNYARCLRLTGEDSNVAYVDLLRVKVKMPENFAGKVPPGCAFVARLTYDIDQEENAGRVEHRITFSFKEFIDLTFEEVPFDHYKGELRDMTGLLPTLLPFDYTRKFEPLTIFDNHFVIYIGNDTFVSMKEGKEYIHKGVHAFTGRLEIGRIYVAIVVPSRIEERFFTLSIFAAKKDDFRTMQLNVDRIVGELERAASEERIPRFDNSALFQKSR